MSLKEKLNCKELNLIIFKDGIIEFSGKVKELENGELMNKYANLLTMTAHMVSYNPEFKTLALHC